MTRVKRAVNAKKKRRKTLELTKGFRGEAKSNYKRAKEALTKADSYVAGSSSAPRKLQPKDLAAAAVVPDPRNGS